MKTRSERHSDQIVADIERTRAEIDQTLSAIEHRLSPGQLVDQGIAYLRQSDARRFASNLGHQVRDNPLPVALVGIGLAWLMASGRDGAARPERWDDPGESLADRAESVMEDVSDAANSAGARMSDAVDRASGKARAARDRVGVAMERASEKARSARDTIGRTADTARQRARDVRDTARHGMERARHGYDRVVDEQPLALGLFGLAVGALVAATVPRTRSEDRLMGEASDRIADRARDAAESGLDEASRMADRAREAMIGDEDQRDTAWREPVPAEAMATAPMSSAPGTPDVTPATPQGRPLPPDGFRY
jgi:hypothetical protein